MSHLSRTCTRISLQRKGVLQFSISYVSLQEYSKTFVKEMFAGGKHNDQTKEIRLETSEADDESFPKFETKSIRNDPINLRNTYPVQAFGLKTTLEIQDEVRYNNRPASSIH
jgi:hypothetical protein